MIWDKGFKTYAECKTTYCARGIKSYAAPEQNYASKVTQQRYNETKLQLKARTAKGLKAEEVA